MTSEQLLAIAKLVAKHESLINLIAVQLSDQACFIEKMLPRCSLCLKHPYTIQYVGVNHHNVCDKCCAESIVKAKQKNDENASKEENWVDIEDAQRIRTITEYVKLVKEIEAETH